MKILIKMNRAVKGGGNRRMDITKCVNSEPGIPRLRWKGWQKKE